MAADSAGPPTRRGALTAMAWAVLLLASVLPRVVIQEVFRVELPPTAYVLITAGVLAVGLLMSAIWAAMRPLVPLLVVLTTVVGAQWLIFEVVDRLPFFQERLSDPSFATSMLTEQSLKLVVTLLVIAVLLVLHRRPSRFFLAPGALAAPMRRIPWLGVKEGTRWSRFGPLAALAISGGTLVFLLVAGTPPPDLVARAVPLLPAVVLAAAANAFYEEVTWKASFLSVLERPVGRGHALLMVAAFFGVNHFYGVPYGLVGVALAFALGWLLGRSMLETRGMFWAWLIHFIQDVLIFSFLALGSIVPGG